MFTISFFKNGIKFFVFILLLLSTLSCFEGLDKLLGKKPLRPSLILTNDSDGRKFYISMSLRITSPPDTEIINKYQLYWGNSADSPAELIKEFNRNNNTIEYTFPDGTRIPDGATHFIVYSVSDKEVISDPEALEIKDYIMDPYTPSLTATLDTDGRKGYITMSLTVLPPRNLLNIEKYQIFWGNSSSNPTEKICELDKYKSVLEYRFSADSQIPSGATHILLYSVTAYDIRSAAESLKIDDYVMVPYNPSLSLTQDTDGRRGYISLSLKVTPPLNLLNIEKYQVYWGSSARIPENIICEFSKNDIELQHVFPADTRIPSAATHIIVYSVSADDIRSDAEAVVLDDYVMNPNAPTFTMTTDTDSRKGYISISITATPPQNLLNIKKYEMCWGSSSTVKTSMISEFDKDDNILQFTFPAGTGIPSDATHIIMYSISEDNDISEPSAHPINDFHIAPPEMTFAVDTDKDENQVAGVLKLTAPVKTDDISKYIIYLGSSSDASSVLCEVQKNTIPFQYSIPADTALNSGETHFVAYSVAEDGRRSEPLFLDIEDLVIKKISDITPGGADIAETSEFYMSEYNGLLYFNARDGTGHGYELWKYDGVNPPTEAVDIYTGIDNSSYPANFCVFNEKLYFKANGGDLAGTELWSFDGTTASIVADIYPGAISSKPKYLKVYNNKLYFSAEKSSTGRELYVYDGSSAPVPAADIYPGIYDSDPEYMAVYNGKLYFKANYQTGSELWCYDGSTAIQVADMNTSMFTGFYPSFLTEFRGELIFSAESDTLNHGVEMWAFNGTGNPYEKFDLYQGFIDSSPKYMTIYNNKLFFSAYYSGAGEELWCYDGANPPQMIADIDSTSYSSSPKCLTVYKEKLYFTAMDASGHNRLWVYYVK